MRRRIARGLAAAGCLTFGLLFCAPIAHAQSTTAPSDAGAQPQAEAEKAPAETAIYSGSLMERSTLTGDWNGERNRLADKGLTIDLSVTQIGQSVIAGGGKPGWEYSGSADLTLNFDTGKAGLWKGGFITLEVENNWGNSVNGNTTAFMPVNVNATFPVAGEDSIGVPALMLTQYLSNHVGLFVGKVATITSNSGDMNAFAHGKGTDNFMNMALNFNPVIMMVPYSALGAGMILLPGQKPEDCVISLAAFDANGSAGESGFDTVFQDGTVFAGEARFKTRAGGLTGHQTIGGAYSDKLYKSLNQNFRIIIENRQLQQTSGAWCVYYNFDQFLYETKPGSGKGWGIFGRFGVSDGDPNPIQYFWSFGFGGKGMIEARPNDGFGVGFYTTITSNANVPAVLGAGDGWGAEAFYNIAITPWAQFSPDLQYVDGALPSGDPAWVLGCRLKLIF